jgi:hypothetical protein
MSPENKVIVPIPEVEGTPWVIETLPNNQIVPVEEGAMKEEKLSYFHETFSSVLDLTAPENVLAKS